MEEKKKYKTPTIRCIVMENTKILKDSGRSSASVRGFDFDGGFDEDK